MSRHSFVRTTKLPDVCGRVDYISNPKRQEHLYAVYSTVEPEFWKRLSEQSQYDFWRSNQKKGKCIEGRELIIALPESLTAADPDRLLQLFTETFRTEYGVQCAAALHHNKAKTNYHIHLIFSERNLLEKTEVRYASRNMFYNEEGRHVRTKKEILDADGSLRPGCRILPKGEPYEIKWFSARRDIFKSKEFTKQVKNLYTDLINQCVTREEDKLQVFDSSGPYLPSKHIGKNNPKAAEIEADNQLRKEWNQTVDQVLIAGGNEEEVTKFKTEEVTKKVADSVREHGNEPGLFSKILIRAISILKEFLEILMQAAEKNHEPKEKAVEPVEPVETDMKVTRSVKENQIRHEPQRKPRPDSRKEENRFMRINPIYQELTKCNKKQYALKKQKETLELALSTTPGGFFHRKERKELQDRIDGLKRQIEKVQSKMETITEQSGFDSVRSITAEYKSAKAALNEIRQKQDEWDGIYRAEIPKLDTHRERGSILARLAEKKAEKEEEKKIRSRENSRGRKERIYGDEYL